MKFPAEDIFNMGDAFIRMVFIEKMFVLLQYFSH